MKLYFQQTCCCSSIGPSPSNRTCHLVTKSSRAWAKVRALLSKRVWGKDQDAHKVAGEPGDVSAVGDVLVGCETHLAGPVLIVADGADAAVRCEQRHAVLVQVAARKQPASGLWARASGHSRARTCFYRLVARCRS